MIDSNYKILTPQDFTAMVRSLNLRNFYFPSLFPMQQTYDLTWRAVEAQRGQHIAGDFVSRGASYPEKTREVFSKIQGEIPKIAAKRVKGEDEINKFNIMLRYLGNDPQKRELINLIFEDIDFVYNSVQSRIEWYALQQISKGKVSLSLDNNNSAITEANIDYDMESWQKLGAATTWTDVSNADPFKDFRNIVEDAEDKGISLKYVFMNKKTWSQFSMIEEVIKRCATFERNVTGTAYSPSLTQANNALKSDATLNGLEIILLDQKVTIEKADGSRVTANPFENNVCLFSETSTLGNTFWMRPADMDVQGTAGYKVLNGATVVKQYGDEEPIREVTSASANAIPAWTESTRSYLLKTNNTSWDL